jgi:hypothetical protein
MGGRKGKKNVRKKKAELCTVFAGITAGCGLMQTALHA